MGDDEVKDGILRYDKMVEGALRQVVRQSLEFAGQQGLPGDHHFYVTFRTDYPGVAIPGYLRAQYPDEMTIVLQHQFWGLRVTDEGFQVTLSFSDKPEQLTIPFAAVTAFADPSVRFGLQFETGEEQVQEGEETGPQVKLPEIARQQAALVIGEENQPAETQDTGAAPEGEGEPDMEGGEDEKVVTLDRFRKK